MLKAFIKSIVLRTPIEPFARAAWRIATKEHKPDPYDDQTIAIMRRVLRKDSNCIDVGCHVGVFLDEMLRLAPRGIHYGFEPLPRMCETLRKKYAKYQNVVVREIALSNSSGKVTFHCNVDHTAYSGIKRRDYPSPNDRVDLIEVRTDRLDTLIPADQKVDFIKVDVEGAELWVFEGALELLRREKPVVVFEHGLGSSEFYESGPKKIFEVLSHCGLKVSLLRNYLNHAEPMSLNAFIRQYEQRMNYYFVAHPN